MKSMSDATGLSGKHTNHSVRRTMISTLRKENVELLNIIALAGQRNLKSLDSYSGTSTKQQKDMSLKLSCYVGGEERHKSVAKSQVLTPKQRDENGGNNLFSGVVLTTAISLSPLLKLASVAIMPPLQRRNSREFYPSLTAR